jgi:hypothetical protein
VELPGAFFPSTTNKHIMISAILQRWGAEMVAEKLSIL